MAFTEFQRDQIRSYLGFPRLYISANPFLESAITSIQPISEGGSSPDASIENAVIAAINQVADVDGYIQSLEAQLINLAVTEVPVSLSNGATMKQDYARAIFILKRQGTDVIQKFAIRLGVQPIRPYFYSDGLGGGSAYANPQFFIRK